MTVTDLLQNAQRVIDAQGQNKAIQLDWSVWESLLAYLKDLDEPDATEELLATPGLAGVGWVSVDLPTSNEMVGNDKPVAHPT